MNEAAIRKAVQATYDAGFCDGLAAGMRMVETAFLGGLMLGLFAAVSVGAAAWLVVAMLRLSREGDLESRPTPKPDPFADGYVDPELERLWRDPR
jgi:hypothetical protein